MCCEPGTARAPYSLPVAAASRTYFRSMIIHTLIARYLKHRDDAEFYLIQATDAVRWLKLCGVELGAKTRVLDLGCGHGVFGAEFIKYGCEVIFSDAENTLVKDLASAPFRQFNIDKDDFAALGEYDLVLCSNVYEHLSKPKEFLESVHKILKPNGKLYLSWTNWLSLWGGHEFSPFHYLGPRLGYRVYDKLLKRERKHTPFENLFPTYIGTVLKMIRGNPNLRILRVAPRYYTEFSFVMQLPLVREFLAWNCAMLIERRIQERR
jgi:SAM-dependent methyltransferase